jgi:hypothetical protein
MRLVLALATLLAGALGATALAVASAASGPVTVEIRIRTTSRRTSRCRRVVR